MKTRNLFFDVAKFFAILMVVFGHVQTASQMTWGAPYIKNFIIGVNMPLFFAISGYFTRRMDSTGSWRYLVIRIANLLWPAFLTSMFLCVVKVVLNANIEGSPVEWLWGKFVSFWFLWVLSACILISFCIDNIPLKGGGAICGISFFAALMLLPSELMHTDKVLQMLPYFMIGRYLLGDVIATIKRLPGFGMTCMFAYMLIIGFSGNVYDNAMGFYWNHVSLSELMLNSSSVVYWIARMGTAVLGIVALLYFFDLLLKFGVVSKLSVFGRTTLGVYILHQDILAVVINPILSPNAMLVLTISVLLFIICHFIIMASKKVNFINAFLWELPKRLLKEN